MQDLLTTNLAQLRALCRKHRVKALHLFGSATRPDFDPKQSDLDFLVEFERLPSGQRADAYFGLSEDFERLFGRRVDLVTSSAVCNPYFLASVDSTKVSLYAAA